MASSVDLIDVLRDGWGGGADVDFHRIYTNSKPDKKVVGAFDSLMIRFFQYTLTNKTE